MRLPPCKPHPELDALLKRAAQHKMTAAERRAQKRSWVAGELALEHDLTMEEAFRRVDAAMAEES